MATLSPRAIEILMGLAADRLENLEVTDREDRLTQTALRYALVELEACAGDSRSLGLPVSPRLPRPQSATRIDVC